MEEKCLKGGKTAEIDDHNEGDDEKKVAVIFQKDGKVQDREKSRKEGKGEGGHCYEKLAGGPGTWKRRQA